MKRSKRIFLIISILFMLLLIWIAWDFSRKTEFRRPAPAEPEQEQRVVR